MKPIKDFPNYLVSKEGEITTKDGKVITQTVDNLGYLKVTLRKDGKTYTKRVHRLVGEAYLKPIEGKTIINHKDGDKTNPSIKNLEYMSNSENTQHGYDNDLYRSRSMLPVIVTGLDGSDEQEFRSIRSLSDELKLNRKTVSSILNNNRNNNYEYVFKYKEAGEMSYIEELYKEASSKVGNVDWGKQKVINDVNFKVRDAKLGEKVVHGVGQKAKQISGGAKKGAAIGKAVLKQPVGKALVGAAAGGQAIGFAAKKIRDKSRDNDTETKSVRDRIAPNMSNSNKATATMLGATVAANKVGAKGTKAGQDIARKLIISKNIQGADKAQNMMKNYGKAGKVLGAGATIVAGAELGKRMRQHSEVKKLDKLSEKHLGRKATDSEKQKIKSKYKAFGTKTSLVTPESEIQNRRRAKAKRQMNKSASDVYLEEIYKEASEKWSKRDKKGYAKNVAIGVAQDFMNAGNPLNVGSSIVGSVLDSAILERSSLKLNKKLGAQEISKGTVDKYNKAVGLKNGTTAVNTARDIKNIKK